jgi:hypothetical protein
MSLVVSHQHKFVFIHIPKTGGTSLRVSLEEVLNIPVSPKSLKEFSSTTMDNPIYHMEVGDQGHPGFLVLENKYNEVCQDYFKFAFVRNPWSRMFSLTCARLNTKNLDITPESFQTSLKWMFSLNPGGDYDAKQAQTIWVFDKSGNLGVDYIARFENFKDECHYLMKKLGFEFPIYHANKSDSSSLDYHHFYNQELVDLVAKKHASDIELFGYTY